MDRQTLRKDHKHTYPAPSPNQWHCVLACYNIAYFASPTNWHIMSFVTTSFVAVTWIKNTNMTLTGADERDACSTDSSWPDAGSMMAQRQRRWANIRPALSQHIVFFLGISPGKVKTKLASFALKRFHGLCMYSSTNDHV